MHGGGAGLGLGDLLDGADQLVVHAAVRAVVLQRLRAAAHGAQHPAVLVHDPQAGLGEGVLGDREGDDAVDLVPVDRVEPGPDGDLGEGDGLGGQPEEPGGHAVEADRPGGVVPAPQARRDGCQDVLGAHPVIFTGRTGVVPAVVRAVVPGAVPGAVGARRVPAGSPAGARGVPFGGAPAVPVPVPARAVTWQG
ncbi:hypothetical protein GCM10020254_42640 [Streptomyces goshikiensis]